MKRILYFSVIAAFAVVACNKNPESQEPSFDFGGEKKIEFRTRLADEASTRATEVTTESLLSFNVVATKGTGSQTLIWDDGVFSGVQGGNYSGGKYWPADETTTDVWNFYAANSEIAFSEGVASLAVSDCGTDVVAEYLANASYRQVNALTFDHVLCQVGTVEMKAPDTYAVTDLKVSLKPIVAGTYNLTAGTWSRGSEGADVYLIGSANEGVSIPVATNYYKSADNDLWLLPGEYELTASYTISKGDYSNSFTKHAVVSLQQGKNNNLQLPDKDGDGNNDDPNIPEPGDIQDILFTVAVTPWSDVDVVADFN